MDFDNQKLDATIRLLGHPSERSNFKGASTFLTWILPVHQIEISDNGSQHAVRVPSSSQVVIILSDVSHPP